MSNANRPWISASLAVSAVAVAAAVLGLTLAHAKGPPKRGRAQGTPQVVVTESFARRETVPIDGPAATTTHQSLAAFRAAQAEAEDLAQRRREQALAEPAGTEVVPHPASTGNARAFQSEIASALSRQNLVPPQRLAHFQWCDTPRLGVRGWKGVVRGVEQTPRGIVVAVEIRPSLVSSSAVTHTPDFVVESYLYTNDGQVTLLGCEEPNGRRSSGVIFGD